MNQRETLRKLRDRIAKGFAKKVASVQAACPHLHVRHYDGHEGHFSPDFPQRICIDCGLEETGGWWCYSLDCSYWHVKDDVAKPRLGPAENRVIVKATSEELRKLKVWSI